MASAPQTAAPAGAVGRALCQPLPSPRASATTTTPPSAATFAAVATFWKMRPDATPRRLMPVNITTIAPPSQRVSPPTPMSRPAYSPDTTPIAAVATAYTSPSIHPTTKPAPGPNASRAYTYLPPALGWRVASSAKISAPRNAIAPPAAQATKVNQGRPSCWATSPGVRKIPVPTMMPTTMARPSQKPSDRLSSGIGSNGRVEIRGALDATQRCRPPPPLRLPPPPLRVIERMNPPPPPPPLRLPPQPELDRGEKLGRDSDIDLGGELNERCGKKSMWFLVSVRGRAWPPFERAPPPRGGAARSGPRRSEGRSAGRASLLGARRSGGRSAGLTSRGRSSTGGRVMIAGGTVRRVTGLLGSTNGGLDGRVWRNRARNPWRAAGRYQLLE